MTPIVDGKEVASSEKYITPANTGVLTGRAAITLTVDEKGQAKFVVRGEKNDYATPIAVYDNGKENFEIDSSDAQATAEIVYFGDAVVGASKLRITNSEGKEVTSIVGNDTAKLEYIALDQNGFPYYDATTQNFDSTFTFVDTFSNYTVTGGNLVYSENNRKTYKVRAVNGIATLYLSAAGKGDITFNASTTNNILTPQNGTVSFNNLADAATLTGKVKSVNPIDNTFVLTVGTVDVPLSYANAALYYKGSAAGVTESFFESKLAVGATVTYNKATDNTLAKFDIIADPAAAKDIPVTITAAQAVDANRDGNVEAIEVTFSKAVNASGTATAPATSFMPADFSINGTAVVGTVADGTASDNKLTINLTTPITGLTVGTLNVAAKEQVGIDGSNFLAQNVSVTAAAALSPLATGLTLTDTVASDIVDGTAATSKVNTLTVAASPNTTGTGVITVAGAGFTKDINFAAVATDTAAVTASKIYDAVKNDVTVTAYYDVAYTSGSSVVTFTNKVAGVGDTADKVSVANVYTTAFASVASGGAAATAEVTTIPAITGTVGASGAGKVEMTITRGGSALATVSIDAANSEAAASVQAKLYAALLLTPAVTNVYDVTFDGTNIKLTNKVTGVVTSTSNATTSVTFSK